MTVYRKVIPTEDRRLGRHVVHDTRSRSFAAGLTVDKTTWRDKAVRVYDPIPNPNQEIGCCTGCAEAMILNQTGNRVTGKVLGMADAVSVYSLATTLDPWQGSYPPTDTGSSGLAAAKAAVQTSLATAYRWAFGGADEIVQSIMNGRAVSVGTYWMWDMFEQTDEGRVFVSGGIAGGHQWTVRGYWRSRDWVMGRCWWGGFRDFWIARTDLDSLMAQDGDAHVTDRRQP